MVAVVNDHRCPVCLRGDTLFDVSEVASYRIFGCRHCGAEHVYPLPGEQELKAYFDRDQAPEGVAQDGYLGFEQPTLWSVDAVKRILEEEYKGKTGLSILDVGCGYGERLDAAAELGWKCFGTQISAHARGIAQERLGGRAYITEEIEDLIPHEFDVVLILGVIEHLADPYALFYSLFSIGAITPKTRVIITTPKARSNEPNADPAEWKDRHPPSHPLYYRERTFEFLLSKLGFKSIRVRGEHLQPSGVSGAQTLASYAELYVDAEGSNFTEFMRERYVPGTWSKIAEYEHLPRYALAKRLVQGKAVLDFGCGTGYGSAVLAGAGGRVLGLDIDAEAIAWARSTHTGSGAQFHCCDDLGATLPSASFDVVTCFEMIEHVDLQTQNRVIEQIARLLRDEGVFVISTPNPEITGMYGANPYHLREMTQHEFSELLGVHFPYVHIVEQRVRDSISFESVQTEGAASLEVLDGHSGSRLIPLAYVAFCSRQPLSKIPATVMFDDSRDVIHHFLDQEKKKNVLRFSSYALAEKVERLEAAVLESERRLEEAARQAQASSHQMQMMKEAVAEEHRVLLEQKQLFARVHLEEDARNKALEEARLSNEQLKAELQSTAAALHTLKMTRSFRLRELLLAEPFSFRKVARVAALVGSGFVPRSLRSALGPRLRRLFTEAPTNREATVSTAYQVKTPGAVAADAPRVVHAIANFMTGGSSRLVVDLVENLGGQYQQSVLTSFNPDPPAYEGVSIEECRFPVDSSPFLEYFNRIRPDFVHVHYWGDCDEPWYAKVIEAARQMGLQVVENINTPIAPHRSDAVVRYVYVSDYVRIVFGESDARHVTIYPGSDFGLFTRAPQEHAPEDCVGMVYRLERDKLNEDAIRPFIRIVQLRPQTRVLIVGGGSLLEPFRAAVEAAGVAENFEFTGYVPYEALADLYRRMSLFVAPVWKESFGQVTPFSMSMKVPVVGYDVGAIGEIIGDRSLLAPPGDEEALAKIVVGLLDAPSQRRQLGDLQQARAEKRFSIQAMIADYERIYAEVAKTARQERS